MCIFAMSYRDIIIVVVVNLLV